jgi:hypothetical protein
MSDTLRWIQRYYPSEKIKSEKHQRKDRSSFWGGKVWRFTKYGRNSKYNLTRKINDMVFKEELEIL